MLTRQFEVIPAVDVLEGRVVRLLQGRREAVTLEGGDPAALAVRFAAEGASRLHLVDLDGAFDGQPSLELLGRVTAATSLPVQVGGGYRSLEAVAAALDAGADRVLVGTAALSTGFLEDASERFGDRLVVAVDARDGQRRRRRLDTRGGPHRGRAGATLRGGRSRPPARDGNVA